MSIEGRPDGQGPPPPTTKTGAPRQGHRQQQFFKLFEHLPEGTDLGSFLKPSATTIREALPLLTNPNNTILQIAQALGVANNPSRISKMYRHLTAAILRKRPELSEFLPETNWRRREPIPGRIGFRFRELRQAAGKTPEEIAAVLEWSPYKIRRLETSQNLFKIQDLIAALNAIGVTQETQPELYTELLTLGKAERRARMERVQQRKLQRPIVSPHEEVTVSELSEEQREALKLKAKGYTDSQIGSRMPSAQGLSNKESHARKLLTGAYQELGTKSSIIAIIKAMDLGYITSDDVLSDDEKAELHSRYVQLKPTHTALLDILTTDDETKKTYKYLVGRDPRFTSVAIIRRIASSAQTTLHTNDIYHTAVVYAIAKKIYGNVPEQEAQPSSPLDSITPRQKQIINLMLQGYNEEQIAGRLVLSDGDTERQFSKRTISEENAKIRKALGIRGGSGDNLALHTILTLIDLDTQGTVIDPALVIQNMDLANLQKLSQEQLPQDVQRVLSELIRDNGAESTNEKIRDRTGIAPGTIKNYFYRLPFATKLQAAVYWKMKDDPRLLEAINDRLHPELSDHNE